MRGPLVWTYLDANMDRQCPNLDCLAPPNEYCRRPDGGLRRVPCIARMKRDDDTNMRVANEHATEPDTLELRYDRSTGVRGFESPSPP